MKRLLPLLLTLCLLFCACAAPKTEPVAPAEESPTVIDTPAETPKAPVNAQNAVADVALADGEYWKEAPINTPFTVDFDGDGALDTLLITIKEMDANYSAVDIDCGHDAYHSEMEYSLSFASCHIGDAKANDGQIELYLNGDFGSDDYLTYLYAVRNGSLCETELDGSVLSADGSGSVVVEGVVDMLGSYGATVSFALNDDFTTSVSSPYTILHWDGDAEYTTLTIKKAGLVAASVADGSTVEMEIGSKWTVEETDCESYVVLQRSGSDERVKLGAMRFEDDWRLFLAGEPEEEWFESLPYAG